MPANDEFENSEPRSQSAAAQMLDDLMAGSFYDKQESAIRSMGGEVKYIYKPADRKIIDIMDMMDPDIMTPIPIFI
jgi:predicted transcriptional regulator